MSHTRGTAAATVLLTCVAVLATNLARAGVGARVAQDPEPVSVPVPTGNTFPIPAPYEVSFSDGWHACRDGCRRQHKGNDLMAAEGTPIVAVESGVIAKVDGTDDGNGGLSVWLLGDSGNAYYYAHNSANLVLAEQRVARGQVIARVGHTGNARSTPPHIHFQINTCGELSSDEPCTVDPYEPLRSWPHELIDGGADAVGLYTPSDAAFRLRTDGGSQLPASSYGATGGGDVPLAGDWDGDGRDTIGVYRTAVATFYLRDDTGQTVTRSGYGRVGDLPLVGDWDGDGRDTVGFYRPSDATFYLRDDAGQTLPPIRYGPLSDVEPRADSGPGPTAASGEGEAAGGGEVLPLAGDWDGDRRDTVALFRRADATFVARDDNGAALPPLHYGTPGDLPLAGDWNGDGRDTVGVYRPADSTYHLQGFTDLPADAAAAPDDAAAALDGVAPVPVAVPLPSGPVEFGPPMAPGAWPVAGDWNGRDLVTLDDLHAIFGTEQDDRSLVENLPLLNAAMVHSGAVTPARKAAFLATIRNESGFRFDAVEAGRSAYRGRGFIQLTGEDNYRRAGAHLGVDLLDDPGLATNPLISAAVASWYWTVARNINLAADRLDMAAVSIAIGYRPDLREDLERCHDFHRALTWFNGGTLPDGVNCQRSPASLLVALATFLPEPVRDPPAAPTTDQPVPPTPSSTWPGTTAPTVPPGTSPPTTAPPATSTTTTTEPPSTTTTTSEPPTTTTTTTEPPSTTTTTEPPSTTTTTEPPSTTPTEPPATTTTTAEPPPSTP